MKKKSFSINRARLYAIIVPVVTFIFGLIGGKLLEALINPLFDKSTKATLAGLFLVGLLIVVLLIVVSTFANRIEDQNTAWLQSIGTPAEFITGLDREGEYHRRLKDLLTQVSGEDTILVITNHRRKNPDADKNESSVKVEARQEYLDFLLHKAQAGDVSYRRVLCFDELPVNRGEVPKGLLPDWVAEHCRKMLELKKIKSDKISLQMSRTRLGVDIFVVRRKFGTILFRLYDPKDKGAASTSASLIFHHMPNAQIVEVLHRWFNEIRDYEVTEHVTNIP